MTVGVDIIRAAVKLEGLLDDECFESASDLIQKLAAHLVVELPSGVTNVSIGQTPPTDSERDNLWIKTDGVNNFIGLFLYIKGDWRQIYPIDAVEYHLIDGDSREPPPGYVLASDYPSVTAEKLANLQKVWTVGGTVPSTWYSVFHVVYVGF